MSAAHGSAANRPLAACAATGLCSYARGLLQTAMTIGTSLFLIAVGAILKWAVTADVEGVRLETVGLILMVVGGVGLAIGLWLLLRARTTPPPADRPF
jgi:phosphate/sulfate permease